MKTQKKNAAKVPGAGKKVGTAKVKANNCNMRAYILRKSNCNGTMHISKINGVPNAKDRKNVIATIEQLKDGTTKIVHGGCTVRRMPDYSVCADIPASIIIDRGDDGKWYVRFYCDSLFGNVVELLKDRIDPKHDLSGSLESGETCGVFMDCFEGFAESEPLTNEQAGKVLCALLPDGTRVGEFE